MHSLQYHVIKTQTETYRKKVSKCNSRYVLIISFSLLVNCHLQIAFGPLLFLSSIAGKELGGKTRQSPARSCKNLKVKFVLTHFAINLLILKKKKKNQSVFVQCLNLYTW